MSLCHNVAMHVLFRSFFVAPVIYAYYMHIICHDMHMHIRVLTHLLTMPLPIPTQTITTGDGVARTMKCKNDWRNFASSGSGLPLVL